MNEILLANNASLTVKEYNGQRVVTFKDIDRVHQRKAGTAKYNFNYNRDKFVEGTDYYKASVNELSGKFPLNSKGGNPNLPVILLTASGYLMIVKSFTDDLSWHIQRQLVDNYFNTHTQSTGVATTEIPVELQMLDKLMSLAKAQHTKIAEHELRLRALEEQKPKEVVSEVNTVPSKVLDGLFASPNVKYSTTSIAEAFNIKGARTLNRFLYKQGVLIPSHEGFGWELNKKYSEEGYIWHKSTCFTDRSGNKVNSVMMWWTESGKDFLCALLQNKGMTYKRAPKPVDKNANVKKKRRRYNRKAAN